MPDLSGRVVLVTGGAGGIGRALCDAFARAGAEVAIASRKPSPEVADAVRAHGRRAMTVQCDVRELSQCASAVERVVKELGRLDVLVNNHGANFLSPAVGISQNGWRAITSVVLDGTFHMSRASFEPLRDSGRGRVISIAADECRARIALGGPERRGQGGSDLADGDPRRRVGAVRDHLQLRLARPGRHRGRENKRLWADKETYERVAKRVPLGNRLATPADVVGPVLFLASTRRPSSPVRRSSWTAASGCANWGSIRSTMAACVAQPPSSLPPPAPAFLRA